MEESEYPKYFYHKLIEGIRGLAMDYEIQLTLIPSEIHWALAHEITEEFDLYYICRLTPIDAGLISEDHQSKIDELNRMLDEVEEKDLLTKEAMRDCDEWNEIRQFSRKLLEIMNEEIRPPYIRRKEDLEGE